MSTKIYVGNLGEDVTADEVRELFEKHGKVDDCEVLKDYGFLHMPNKSEARAAIEALNGHNLKDHTMRVEIETPSLSTKIFIGNLKEDVTADEIRELFEKHGKVDECDVLKNYGFVHMPNKSEAHAAVEALKGHDIRGQKMRVEYCRKTSNKIFIGNLAEDVTADKIRELFEKHGTVDECDVLKNYGFVHMPKKSEALAAIEALHGHNIDGQKMRVELSTGERKGDRRGYDPYDPYYRYPYYERDPYYRKRPRERYMNDRNEPKMRAKIYVGNLGEDVTADEIRELFEKHGKVDECEMLKDHGFVNMPKKSDALAAIEALNGHNHKGHTMRVEIETLILSTKIFIGNLKEDATADEIRELFEKYGKVDECDVLKNYGFVHMPKKNEAHAAIEALNGHDLRGQKMKVEHCRKTSNKIFIGNLAEDVTADDIRELFEKHGKVDECDVLKNYGFAHMPNKSEAQEAIEALNGHYFRGQRMRVELSTGERRKPKGDRRGYDRDRPYPPGPPRRGPPPPDRYDPYYRYLHPEMDPYYRLPPMDRFMPRLPPRNDRYRRERPPPQDPHDRYLSRERLPHPDDQMRSGERMPPPADPYRERSPIGRPPPEYYERRAFMRSAESAGMDYNH